MRMMVQTNAANVLIRQPAAQRRPPSAMDRGRRGLLAVLIALTGAAWALTLAHTQPLGAIDQGAAHHAHPQGVQDAAQLATSGMAGAEWSGAGLAAFVVAWAVMMMAMMFPGLTPMLLTMHAISHHRLGRWGGLRTTAVFVGGYLLVWTAVGCLTWAIVRAIGLAASRLDVAQRGQWATLLLGGTLVVAGLYQFTPFKQMCLDHCRSPFIEVMQRWREGYGGALRMGIGHGLYCLGCCWALFTVLVAAGIMSLAWMLALTLIDSAEKTLPIGRGAAQVVGVALLVLGLAVTTRAIGLPGVL
jgi:predicted metal-binding membrane protein